MTHRLRIFLETLRASSESRKRRWTAGLSAVSMALVFTLWLVTFQANVGVLDPAAQAEEEERPNAFFGTFKAGSVVLWDAISSAIGREREVTIERDEFTFTPKNTPAAPIYELPTE